MEISTILLILVSVCHQQTPNEMYSQYCTNQNLLIPLTAQSKSQYVTLVNNFPSTECCGNYFNNNAINTSQTSQNLIPFIILMLFNTLFLLYSILCKFKFQDLFLLTPEETPSVK